LPAAIGLYEKALGLVPHNVGYALSLVHTLELGFDYDKAIQVALKFFIKNRLMKVGALSGKMIAEFLEDPDPTREQWTLTWTPTEDDRGYATAYPDNNPPPESSAPPVAAAEEDWDNPSMDFMALVFTVVKMLYFKGALHRLPPLINMIEPTRRCSRQALHLTSIRNEHAYYSTIIQILANRLTHASPAEVFVDHTKAATAAVKPLYVIGDSHVSPLAWSKVMLKRQERLLVPKLVTGIKHWHLRPSSDFYPKANFQSAVSSCPIGSG
jgi:hypothetical protein